VVSGTVNAVLTPYLPLNSGAVLEPPLTKPALRKPIRPPPSNSFLNPIPKAFSLPLIPPPTLSVPPPTSNSLPIFT
jgi:hypothetical protein